MKKFYFFRLLLCTSFVFSQHYTARYSIKSTWMDNFKEDTPDNKELASMLDEDASGIEFKLNFSNNNSVFYYNSTLKKSQYSVNIPLIIAQGMGFYYSDKEKGIFLNQKTIDDEYFIIQDSIATLKWKLTEENKKIGTYLCYKATRETPSYKLDENGKIIGVGVPEIVVAWYCPQLPFSHGPNGNYGLPGLILELQQGMSFFYLKSLDLKPNAKIKIAKPLKGKLVSPKEYQELYDISEAKHDEEDRPKE
jgi:GLPGLI family protein